MGPNGIEQFPLRFDLFELDLQSYQLRRSGVPVDVPPQALKILVLLTSRPDELVTRKEIKETLWPGEPHGDFDSRLNFAIKKLREALGDSAERPRYLLTVRSAGFRFIAPVRAGQVASSNHNARTNGSDGIGARGPAELGRTVAAGNGLRWSRRKVFYLATLAVTLAVVGVVVLRRWSDVVESGTWPEIRSVSLILPQPRQTIIIRGTGFGRHDPYRAGNTRYIAIRDETAHWAAGRKIPTNEDDVTLDVVGWGDGEIVLDGFSGAYGQQGWKLNAGDQISILVWNPKSGAGPAGYRTQVASTVGH